MTSKAIAEVESVTVYICMGKDITGRHGGTFKELINKKENVMAFQIEYSYRVIKSTWGIAIDIKCSLDIVSRTNVPLKQFHHIQGCIFCQMPEILNDRECNYIKSGIEMMYKEIIDNCDVGKDEAIIIALTNIRYNPCDYQEEGLQAAIIMCLQEMFKNNTIKINTTFDYERKRYCFEYVLI